MKQSNGQISLFFLSNCEIQVFLLPLSMAAPITHIVLSEKIFPTYFSQDNPRQFYVGTSFPDIRYLGIIDREKTHFKGQILADVLNEKDSFARGLRFHSLVDEVREKYIVEEGIYTYLPESKFITQSVKFVEDWLFWEQVTDWMTIKNYFNTVLDNEIALVSDKTNIEKWHTLLSTYMSQQPTIEQLHMLVTGFGFPQTVVDEIAALVQTIKQNDTVVSKLKKMTDIFPELIS